MKKGMKSKFELPAIESGGVAVEHGVKEASGLRFGIVVSRFNQDLTGQLLQSALDCLRGSGAAENMIEVLWVPGAYEVPQAAERLLLHDDFDALIGLGCVVQGETPHAELINAAVAEALMSIARAHVLPVINEVVGAYTIEQAEERCRYGEGSRGWYAAEAAIEMATLFKKIGARGGGGR